jgi:hypothetical protein
MVDHVDTSVTYSVINRPTITTTHASANQMAFAVPGYSAPREESRFWFEETNQKEKNKYNYQHIRNSLRHYQNLTQVYYTYNIAYI